MMDVIIQPNGTYRYPSYGLSQVVYGGVKRTMGARAGLAANTNGPVKTRRSTYFGGTAITIAAGFLGGYFLEHEWQPHEQRHGPKGRNVLTYNLSCISSRENLGFLVIDHMDVADVRRSHWG